LPRDELIVNRPFSVTLNHTNYLNNYSYILIVRSQDDIPPSCNVFAIYIFFINYINAKTNFIARARSYVHAQSREQRHHSFSFSRSTRRLTALVFLWRAAYSAFVSRTPFFTVYLAEIGVTRSQTATRNRAEIWQFSIVGFAGRMPARCLFAFEVRTIRGSRVCFREARRSAVSSTVSTRLLARTVAAAAEGNDVHCRERKRERDTVEAGCTRCLGWSTNFFSSPRERLRTKDYEGVTKGVQRSARFHFANITNKIV